jgi:HK97 family phage major capsid protein
MDLETLRHKHRQLTTETAKILKRAEAENRKLSPAEELKFEELMSEAEQLGYQIRQRELDEAREREEVIREERERRGGAPIGEGPTLATAGSGRTLDQRCEALGYLVRGAVRQTPADFERAAKILGVEHRAALEEGTATEGGNWVPTYMLVEVLRGFDPGVIRPISRDVPMTGQTLDVPTLASKPSVAIVDEEGSVGDAFGADPIGKATLTAKKLISVVTISKELLDDTPIEMGRFLLTEIVEAIGQVEDAQALEGDGTGTNFSGIYTVSGTSSVAVSAALTTIDPFIEAMKLLAEKSPSYLNEATFVMSPACWEKVSQLKHPGYSGDTTGKYMVTQNPLYRIALSLLGRPVVLCNQIDDTRGTGNDTTAYLGAFRRGLVFGDRNKPSLFVDPYSAAATWQTKLYLGERVGVVVALPEAFVKLTGIDVT